MSHDMAEEIISVCIFSCLYGYTSGTTPVVRKTLWPMWLNYLLHDLESKEFYRRNLQLASTLNNYFPKLS